MDMTTRGIRNNNPMCIRLTTDRWVGMAYNQTDREFVQFINVKYGLRAGLIILHGYITKHHLRTIPAIIGRWAPASENDTSGYVNQVCSITGIKRDQVINAADRIEICSIAQAICKIESNYKVSLGYLIMLDNEFKIGY